MNLKEMLARYKNMPMGDYDKLREILQQAALLGLYRSHFFKYAAFYGGTALRILHGLERFSEDLDFSLFEKNAHFDFEPFLTSLSQEMQAMGFDVQVEEKEKKVATGIVSAFLKTNTIHLLLELQEHKKVNLLHPQQKLKIKLEIDTDPPLGFRTISALVREPTPFQVTTYHLSDLFAGKMHAILHRAWKNRVKGRDWFDLVWFVQKGIPLNFAHLQERIRHVGDPSLETPQDFYTQLQQKIQSIDWELAKKDVRGFIVDARQLEAWSPDFFSQIAEHIKFE